MASLQLIPINTCHMMTMVPTIVQWSWTTAVKKIHRVLSVSPPGWFSARKYHCTNGHHAGLVRIFVGL